MSQTPVIVTYSLEEILGQINTKLNTLNDIRVELAEVKAEVKNLKDDVKDIKGSSKAQIWTLIGILITAVSGFLVAVGRFVLLTPKL
jgi:predicted ATPase with chaperone activity